MTTVPMTSNDCPTEELIAAFIDDRLDPATRRTVMEHITTCGDCRDVIWMAREIQDEERAADANVIPGSFGARRWFAPAAGLAAAAVIAVLVLKPSPMFTPHADDVLASASGLKKWPVESRVQNMAYKPYNQPKRGDAENNDAPWQMLVTLDKIERAWVPDRHAKGISLLLQRQSLDDLNAAVDALTEALKAAPKSEVDSISIDLSAALLARDAWVRDEKHADLIQALLLSEGVWRRTGSPEAAWNRALALQGLGRDDQAIRAWEDYLKLDPSSPWAKDARRNKDEIKELSQP